LTAWATEQKGTEVLTKRTVRILPALSDAERENLDATVAVFWASERQAKPRPDITNINLLTPGKVSAAGQGRHCDGGYLWLKVDGASKSWVVRTPRVNGKRREIGLGSVDRVSLAQARRKRDEILAQLRDGRDPLAERQAAKEALARKKTFAEVAELVIANRVGSWKVSELKGKSSTLEQWRKDVDVVCKPLAHRFIDEITLEDIKPIVMDFFDRRHDERALQVLGRIEIVFNFARAHGWRVSDNPASWAIWEHLAPKRPKTEEPHHAALPWADVPELLARIRAVDVISARLTEFVILTAVRSQEARGARWSEIDFDRKVWTIPGERMKKGLDHEVPLSEAAIELLNRVERTDAFVFVGGWGSDAQALGKPMTHGGLWAFVRRATGGEATVHGFRSAFKDWARSNGVSELLSEAALAHLERDATKRAYGRDQLTEPRRPVMEAWARFVSGIPADDNVVPLKRTA
jgi:integrase